MIRKTHKRNDPSDPISITDIITSPQQWTVPILPANSQDTIEAQSHQGHMLNATSTLYVGSYFFLIHLFPPLAITPKRTSQLQTNSTILSINCYDSTFDNHSSIKTTYDHIANEYPSSCYRPNIIITKTHTFQTKPNVIHTN